MSGDAQPTGLVAPATQDAPATVAVWTCPSCAQHLVTRFCPQCGERRIEASDLQIASLLPQLVRAFSKIDGKLLRSAYTLACRPGELTLAYFRGARLRYLKPFPFFMIANVTFFAVQSVAGTKIFSTPLQAHLQTEDWRQIAQRLVAARMNATDATLAAYAPVFDQAIALNAKSLIVLMALAFMFVPMALFWRRRIPFVIHVVFSMHFYTFFLGMFCVAAVLLTAVTALGGPGLEAPAVDLAITLIWLGVAACYLYAAIGRVYGTRGVMRLAQAGFLAITVLIIMLGYRFAVFLITLYTT